MRPRIAIPVPTCNDWAYNQRSWPHYAAAVAGSGGEPVQVGLMLSPAEMRTLTAGCDGFVLPGSPADVDPALYGEDRLPECAAADPAREATDSRLLDGAAAQGKPVLAICYGMQSLNVWRGGSLVQDLAPLPVNHSAGGKVAVAHSALVARDSLLASLLTHDEAPDDGGFLRLPINSSHHQAVAAPGDGLRIVARCPQDGVIEAIELDPGSWGLGGTMFHVEHSSAEASFEYRSNEQPKFLMGLQWHPERSYEISAASRAVFDLLISHARPLAERRVSVSSRVAAPWNGVEGTETKHTQAAK